MHKRACNTVDAQQPNAQWRGLHGMTLGVGKAYEVVTKDLCYLAQGMYLALNLLREAGLQHHWFPGQV